MALGRYSQRIQTTYHDYPQQFWILMGATFIDRLGGALLFPFFTLYVTARYGVSMTTVGLIFGVFSISSVVGSGVGGALADRLGRKKMLIFGLVTSATVTLLMGFAPTLPLFLVAAVASGVFADTGGPAQQAMVADLLPEGKRAEGYGLQRVVSNLAVVIGPAVGGLLATRSYLSLFIVDAIASTITALIVLRFLDESMPERTEAEVHESMWQTFRGYGVALRDKVMVVFLIASILTVLAYMQMNTTLSVYLRDYHGVPPQGFGWLLSMNAAMVVLFQFWVTRQLRGRPRFLMMTLGVLLYAIGFGMYGLVGSYPMFMVAMIIITIGEMVAVPMSQAIVARLSPEDMRGRYMAVYGLSWILPTALGTLLAGLVIDNFNPDWVWYGAAIACLLAAAIYLGMSRWVGETTADQRAQIAEEPPLTADG